MNRNCRWIDIGVASHSLLFIPKMLVKKLSGRKKIVTIVKSMIERP